MRKFTTITLVLCWIMPLIVCAQSVNSSSATKFASGTIRSFDGATLVVRSEVNGQRETTTFVVTGATHKEGELVRGADATVQYRVDGSRNLALFVQAAPPELETLEYAKSTIGLEGEPRAHITSGNNVVVEGRATNHDKFQHDVFLTATLFDAAGKSVGTASGKLEDLPAGHGDQYQLSGAVTSTTWARVSVAVSNVTEHVQHEGKEKN